VNRGSDRKAKAIYPRQLPRGSANSAGSSLDPPRGGSVTEIEHGGNRGSFPRARPRCAQRFASGVPHHRSSRARRLRITRTEPAPGKIQRRATTRSNGCAASARRSVYAPIRATTTTSGVRQRASLSPRGFRTLPSTNARRSARSFGAHGWGHTSAHAPPPISVEVAAFHLIHPPNNQFRDLVS
jgi:hypothetical protein